MSLIRFRDAWYAYALGRGNDIAIAARDAARGGPPFHPVPATARGILWQVELTAHDVARLRPPGASAPDELTLRALIDELDSPFARIQLLRRELVRPRVTRVHADEPPPPRVHVEPTTNWLEIELIDESGDSVGGKRYEIRLPSGAIRTGALDARGYARVDAGTERGSATLTFLDVGSEFTIAPAA